MTDIIEPGMFSEEQMKGLLNTLITKLTQIAKDAVAEAHIVKGLSVVFFSKYFWLLNIQKYEWVLKNVR